jgi:hypothetical protein
MHTFRVLAINMELLIPGLILVALMVYASTKIKKAAAAAFAPESIETDAFAITKPEGMINPIRDESPYLFEAYSKDYGDDDQRNERRLSAYVHASNSTAAEAADDVRRSMSSITNEYSLGDSTVIEGTENGFAAAYKISESKGRSLVLKVLAIEKYAEENAGRMSELVYSFRVK